MDFEWSEAESRFRAELREFLAQNVSPLWGTKGRQVPTPELYEACREFCIKAGEHGYLTPHWPVEHGGRDASLWEKIIIAEEMWGAGEPRGPQYMNVNWIGPAIMRAGTSEQQAFHLPRLARGDTFWCQGFSEPNSGTDLASLATSAVPDGDDYVVNGQKVWTSYAHVAQFCFLLVRTDPSAGRDGITILLVPMGLPGIEVREIATPFQPHVIHEIFFTDVRVPQACRLGEENRGWQLVRSVLAEERIGIARYTFSEDVLDQTLDAMAQRGVDPATDPVLMHQLGQACAQWEASKLLMYAAVQEQLDDIGGARPMASVWRAIGAGFNERMARELFMSVMGDEGLVEESPADLYTLLGVTSPITSGTLELQLNLVARTALSLPKAV
jgi:alkylation response protein AidB-like acyl-CoA dehydrogenase